MNQEHPFHKTGLIGEYFVKIKLNDFGVNTGGVDKDTGTDIVMFSAGKILTAQVKTGYNVWNMGTAHGVNILLHVRLVSYDNDISFDKTEIKWRRVDVEGEGLKVFSRSSIAEFFS